MLVNRVSDIISKIPFKGQQHVVNSAGKNVEKFSYPYDYTTETCEVEFVRARKDNKYDILLDESSKVTIPLKPEGVEVDTQELLGLDDGESYAYKIRIKDKDTGNVKWEGADTGVKLKNQDNKWGFRISDGMHWEDVKNDRYSYSYPTINYADLYNSDNKYDNPYKYTLITTNGTTPMSNGSGVLVMPDSLMPGAKFRDYNDPNTGEVYIDEAAQKNAELANRTFSNILGGGIAGMIAIIPYLKANGYEMLFGLPITNGASVDSHGYWNKNNNQINARMGNTENYAEFMRQLYKNNIQYVNDGTFTSEGLEGIHFQYAWRWAQHNPQTYYWFRMPAFKKTNLAIGVIPDNAKNLSHRVINSPYNYEKQSNGTYKRTINPKYNPNKETIFQIYDSSQVSESLKNALDKQIRAYDNIISGNPLEINTHDDTIIAYAFQINPYEYDDRIDVINDLIKSGKEIDLYSTDGTILAGQFSNFKIDRKTEGGFVAWDANTDMVKMNYGISGYDLKNLKAIPDRAERYHEQKMVERGTFEVQDLAIQSGRYWTGMVRDIQTLYTAKVVGLNKTPRNLDSLFEKELLPKTGKLDEVAINNILNGEYIFRTPKGVLSKDDVTVKYLMTLPMDALEFGENIAGVLSTSYFSNRATTEETVGKTRYELLKESNPHLVGEYAGVYNKVNSMFTGEVKDFADKIIEKVNSTSNTKLLDSSGNYTEYGEYVIELVARDIAKYAFLKSLAGENFSAKIMNNGDLTYDYEKIKENTTLKTLRINASNPKEEAERLQKMMKKGLKKLSSDDVDLVAESISQRISGTDEMSFRLAEAIVNKASKGLAWRLDAAKDVMDQDAVRNRENDFNDVWDSAIKFWKKFIQGIKLENQNAYIVAEITDVNDLMRKTYGAESCPYDGNTNVNDCKFNGHNEAETKFFTETGITSEAAYSYLFTNLLHNFSGNFENGDYSDGINHDDFKRRVDYIMQTRSADYLRNLYTFIGNHDKTRTIQGLAVDMKLFQSPISYSYDLSGKINFGDQSEQRQKVIQVLSGVLTPAEVPIELRLNVDNMNYFRTISPKAVAQAQLFMHPIYEELSEISNPEDIKAIKEALIDLANGNYKINKKTQSMTRINIPEIATLEKAIAQILDMAEGRGFVLSPEAKKYLAEQMLKKANSMNLSDYQVHGDFDWEEPNEEVGTKNKEYLSQILGTSSDCMNYSLYTVQLARLLKDSYYASGDKKIDNPAFNSALKDFINKYNRNYVDSRTSEPIKIEPMEITRNKDAFGVNPFELSMELVINQAEFKTGRKISNRKAIIDKVVTSITEPAIQKQAMILSFLNGLVGIPTIFAGDEYGMSGYEDKAKNKYLKPRIAVRRNSINAERYSRITNETLTRNIDELHPLNDGTPYSMDVLVNGKNRDGVQKRLAEIGKEIEIVGADSPEGQKLKKEQRELTKELAKVSYMMYSSNGDAVVSVFSAQDVNHSNRFDYYKYLADEYGIDTDDKRRKAFADGTLYSINPENRYVPIQHRTELDAILLGTGISLPVGTIFLNSGARDNVEYVVRNLGGKLGIVRKDGKKIVMDGKTAKNGVMLLRRIKNIIFKGNGMSSQYNVVSNPYLREEPANEGEKLSIIAG